MSLLGKLFNRRQPVAEPDAPADLRYVYRVVVDGESDDKLLVRDEPVTIEAEVPFRDRTVVVEKIEDLHERDRSGEDLGERRTVSHAKAAEALVISRDQLHRVARARAIYRPSWRCLEIVVGSTAETWL